MKRFLPLLMLTGLLFGQTINDLSPNQQQRYNREKLTIQLINKSSGGTTLMPLGNTGMYTGFSNSATTRDWKAYKGMQQISEAEFLHIAGYYTEANKARNYKSSADNPLIYGGCVTVIAIAMLLKPVDTDDMDDEEFDAHANRNLFWSITGGLGFLAFIGGSTIAKSNYYPYETVVGIADSYNQQLIKNIPYSTQ